MRYTIGTLSVTVALAASCLATVGASTAHAESARPADLSAPSELVLTIGKGVSADTAAVERAVTLRCIPTAGGDHPTPEEACEELAAADGDFAALTAPESHRMCMKIWDPVVLTAVGVWNGEYVSYSHMYPNACMAQDASTYVFDF
jgi:hypothetical protein